MTLPTLSVAHEVRAIAQDRIEHLMPLELIWAVSIMAVRFDEEGMPIVSHQAAFFRGPHLEWVEMQAVLFALEQFPESDGWRQHDADAVSLPAMPQNGAARSERTAAGRG